jgi:maltoporin
VLVLALGAYPVHSQTADPAPPAPAPSADAAPPNPDGFRFHGYLRSGFGVNGNGKALEPFRAPNADAKYRLGNEAEAYLETTFDYGVTPDGDPGAFFDTRITVSYVTPTSRSNSFDTTVALREAWALARGVWKAQPGATFWAGQRFYDRHDLHMNDFYYRDMSGFGGGIDDIAAGERARIAVAWLGGAVDELDPNGSGRRPSSTRSHGAATSCRRTSGRARPTTSGRCSRRRPAGPSRQGKRWRSPTCGRCGSSTT